MTPDLCLLTRTPHTFRGLVKLPIIPIGIVLDRGKHIEFTKRERRLLTFLIRKVGVEGISPFLETVQEAKRNGNAGGYCTKGIKTIQSALRPNDEPSCFGVVPTIFAGTIGFLAGYGIKATLIRETFAAVSPAVQGDYQIVWGGVGGILGVLAYCTCSEIAMQLQRRAEKELYNDVMNTTGGTIPALAEAVYGRHTRVQLYLVQPHIRFTPGYTSPESTPAPAA
ncbi:hypothetical protein COT30_05160 [Candidatus Micrarchaeota archaeon CG08_land_8_20_14_0_20_49_17]|nr:MAG: hypothetical protein COT30_05160 [Candidatus Micrarchaeota archaeon CG08_land_8_20_14_0_20_49_17]